jgi:hypothetical protein
MSGAAEKNDTADTPGKNRGRSGTAAYQYGKMKKGRENI